MNAAGTNTAARIRAIAITGPETSSIALRLAFFRRQAFPDVALNGRDDHDGVVHPRPDREHQPEERERVNREAQQWEHHERPDQGDRDRE